MKKQQRTTPAEMKKEETAESLKKETQKDSTAKKGYNEKNPTQPQGAFVPDALNKKR
ncbi:MAG: hypothetical protein ABIN36_19770 [Ferruginibacter sp.]